MYNELDPDLPEREISSVELRDKNSDESGEFSRENVVSNSSFLSDGWCISILGKPCANLKIYADREPEDRNVDNIGNLFSTNRLSKENLTISGIADITSASEIEDFKPRKIAIVKPQVETPLEDNQTPHREDYEPLKVAIAYPEVEAPIEENQTPLGKAVSPENSINIVEQPPPTPVLASNLENAVAPVVELPKKEIPKATREVQLLDNKRTDLKNQAQNIIERKADTTDKPSSKAERHFGTEDSTVIYIGCKRSGKYSKSKDKKDSRKQKNFCCDEDCQTSHPSILKPSLRSGSSCFDPCSGKRHQKTSTGTMDAFPVKEPATRSRAHKDVKQQIVLTSDKILQTSDDRICFFRCGRDSASNTEQTNMTDSYVNTMNTESTKMQTSENTWSDPYENRCCRCSMEQRKRVCSCSSPGCRSRMVERRASFSSLESSPRTLQSYPSEMRSRVLRKKSPKAGNKFVETSEESTAYICVPPCEGFQKHPFEPRRFHEPKSITKSPGQNYTRVACDGRCKHPLDLENNNEPNVRTRSPSGQNYARVIPCNGRCRYPAESETQQNYRSLPFRPPPPPIPRDFSSSDEESGVDEDDVDGFMSDGSRRHRDLPYQNNEEYLELVHELEETLQNRNRNRVKRAMKEFENKSKYNRPLEQPIINYEEPSESEEPIIRRISELNEKRMIRCQGDCCGCRKEDQATFQSKSKRPMSKPNKSKKFPRDQARWQMDNQSGEWFKVGENSAPKFRPTAKPAPRGRFNELPCGCACSCGK